METTDTCFCKKSFIDRSYLVLEILKRDTCAPSPFPPRLHKLKKPMVNTVKIYQHQRRIWDCCNIQDGTLSDNVLECCNSPRYAYGHIEKSDLFVSVSRSGNFKQEAHRYIKEVYSYYIQEKNSIMQDVHSYIQEVTSIM